MAVWRSTSATTKLKPAIISYLHIHVWQSLTKLPNLKPPIFLQRQFGGQPPNLIPANISIYMVGCSWCCWSSPESSGGGHEVRPGERDVWQEDHRAPGCGDHAGRHGHRCGGIEALHLSLGLGGRPRKKELVLRLHSQGNGVRGGK